MIKEKGYEIIAHSIMPSDIQNLWRELHGLIVNQLLRFELEPTMNMQTNLEMLLAADKQTYINTLSLASRLRSALELFLYLGFKPGGAIHYPVLHVMANSLKIPDGYFGTVAHQDWASTQGSLETTTVWIPITNTKDNFPLEVIPESHKQGLLDGVMNGSVLEVTPTGKFIPVEANFGDAVLLDSFLVHRTGAGGDGLRIAVSMRFENVSEPTFIERGYPCAQKRTVDREIKWRPSHVE